jgi:hypothetical protein
MFPLYTKESSNYNLIIVNLVIRAMRAQSVWRWATGWIIGVLGFDSQWELGILLFTTVSRTGLGPTQHPIQWVPGALSLGVKLLGRKADHSPPSSSKVKNAWSYTSIPQYVFMVWYLVKHRDNVTFTFTFTILLSVSVHNFH